MSCQCKICVLTGKVLAVQEKLVPEDRAVIEQLLNEWAHEGMEAGYHRSMIEGHWPSSKRIAMAPPSGCKHDWTGSGEMPAKWNCQCGTVMYRSYADYCWD